MTQPPEAIRAITHLLEDGLGVLLLVLMYGRPPAFELGDGRSVREVLGPEPLALEQVPLALQQLEEAPALASGLWCAWCMHSMAEHHPDGCRHVEYQGAAAVPCHCLLNAAKHWKPGSAR